MTELVRIEGWPGAAISAVVTSGTVRVEFGSSGHLIIFSPFHVHVGASSVKIDPMDTSAGVPEMLQALTGLHVLEAVITEVGSLQLRLDGASVIVEPDDEAEAFQLAQRSSPQLVVCGFGGEIFEWEQVDGRTWAAGHGDD